MLECAKKNKKLLELAKEMKSVCRQQDCRACVLNVETKCKVKDYSPNMWALNEVNEKL